MDREGRDGVGALGTVYYDGDGHVLGSMQYGPAHLFPRAAELPAGPPSADAVLVTCAYLVETSSPWVVQSLFLAAIGDAKDRGAKALETFAFATGKASRSTSAFRCTRRSSRPTSSRTSGSRRSASRVASSSRGSSSGTSSGRGGAARESPARGEGCVRPSARAGPARLLAREGEHDLEAALAARPQLLDHVTSCRARHVAEHDRNEQSVVQLPGEGDEVGNQIEGHDQYGMTSPSVTFARRGTRGSRSSRLKSSAQSGTKAATARARLLFRRRPRDAAGSARRSESH